MTPITDKKREAKIYRIVATNDPTEPFGLLNDLGNQIRTAANPRRLADWALDFEDADFVRHDYDIVAHEAKR